MKASGRELIFVRGLLLLHCVAKRVSCFDGLKPLYPGTSRASAIMSSSVVILASPFLPVHLPCISWFVVLAECWSLEQLGGPCGYLAVDAIVQSSSSSSLLLTKASQRFEVQHRSRQLMTPHFCLRVSCLRPTLC